MPEQKVIKAGDYWQTPQKRECLVKSPFRRMDLPQPHSNKHDLAVPTPDVK